MGDDLRGSLVPKSDAPQAPGKLAPVTERCPWAIRWAGRWSIRCAQPAGHPDLHMGPDPASLPAKIVQWHPGDRREYLTGPTQAPRRGCR
jgi:hypothetical protein